MKDFKDIFYNNRLSFIKFVRTKNNDCSISGSYLDIRSSKRLNFMFTNSLGWEHLSVSTPSKCPTWEQMCLMKDCFWNEDEVCMQLHPKKEDYVDNHPYCLHIWRPINDNIPTPPRIMVGIKTKEDKEKLIEMVKNGIGQIKDEDIIKDELYYE